VKASQYDGRAIGWASAADDGMADFPVSLLALHRLDILLPFTSLTVAATYAVRTTAW